MIRVTGFHHGFSIKGQGENKTMKMKRMISILLVFALMGSMTACGSAETGTQNASPTALAGTDGTVSAERAEDRPETGTVSSAAASEQEENQVEEKILTMMIDDTAVEVDWEDNESVSALRELADDHPLTVQMSRYGGFEQVGALGTSLPNADQQTTTQAGDIVLYSGDQIVVFYGSNSWAYTRLGHIADKTEEEMAELLGNGDVVVTLSVE